MKDLVVENPIPDTDVPYIVHKIDAEKDIIEINVTDLIYKMSDAEQCVSNISYFTILCSI